MVTPGTPSYGQNHVWVRIDVVEALLEHQGRIPRGWSPRKRRRGQTQHWEWAKAFVISNATPTSIKSASPTSPFGNIKLRSVSRATNGSPFTNPQQTQGKASTYSHPVTVQIDDKSHALNGTAITLDPAEHELCSVLMANPPREAPNDLTSLTHLHEPAVVECLQQRYRDEAIYTYTGKILLAMNPFRLLPGLYGDQLMENYWKTTDQRHPPHIYAIAQEAHSNMTRFSENQSILVSGESGAGKTVTTKIIMRYLTTLSRKSDASQSIESIEAQVLQSNPVLESFGNARTVRNDNSSRFGKFIEISFLLGTGKLISASIETYLLEKVRLITQAPGERNYHIFYEVLTGLPQRERKALHIGNVCAKDFHMTCQSGTFDRRDGVDDKDTYKDLGSAMDTVGFTKKEQNDMFTVICALLHCSNLTFVETGPDASAMDQANPSLRAALSLLGVAPEDLNKALCSSAIEARGEIMHKNLSTPQATKALEALMKATYSALFTHIVRRVNQSIRVCESPVKSPIKGRSTAFASIGVLDIFGFESFDVNSFEQLCINFCNEALQQQFNRCVFKLEQEEYEREGIEWSFISFPDNQDVLDLIEKKHTGILSILDEQCLFPRSSDQTFARATYEKCMGHSRFTATNTQRVNFSFSIEHYAGLVAYGSHNFIEKNKDELPKETTDLLMSSTRPFIVDLGKLLRDPPSGSTSVDLYMTPGKPDYRRSSSSLVRESVGSQFISQLRELRERINLTTPHYVRCLKPNDNLVPGNFHPLVIADQLRCAGVLEAIRVSRVGFPQRYTHDGFVQRYGMLLSRNASRQKRYAKGKDLCEMLVKATGELISARLHETGPVTGPAKGGCRGGNNYDAIGIQLGLSKVFLRQGHFDILEYLRNQKLAIAAVRVQAVARGFLASIHFEMAMWAITVLQKFTRRLCALRLANALRQHRSAIRIQSLWRVYLAEIHLIAALVMAQWCQRNYRGAAARRICKFKSFDRKAEIIQKHWRRYYTMEQFRGTIHLAVLLQSQVRSYQARLKLKQLRRKARDLDAVVAERDKFRAESSRLRKQLEEAQKRQTLAPVREDQDLTYNLESENVLQLKEEIRRLQTQLLNTSFLREDEEVYSVATVRTPKDAERAAKDAELEMLRMEVALLRSPSAVSNARSSNSTLSRSFSFQRESSNDQDVFRPRGIPAHIATSESPQGTRAAGFLSPLTNFLRKNPTKEARVTVGKDASKSLSFISPVRFVNVNSNQSVASTSLLDGDEISPHTYETMNVSPMAKHMMQSSNLVEGQVSSDTSFRLAVHRFHNTIRQGDEEGLKATILKSDILDKMINETDPHTGETSLHMAVRSANAKNTKLLLENGAVANCQDIDGNTPLHLANKDSILALLLERGMANPNIPNIAGVCSLHYAVERRDAVAVGRLLRYGANVNVADNSKWFTPLHVVCHRHPQIGNIDDLGTTDINMGSRTCITRLLCDVQEPSPADPNSEDWEGNTPLHHVVTLTDDDVASVLSILLEKGGNPNAVNKRGQTPLHLLSHNEALREMDVFQEMLHDMLFHGGDPNFGSKSGCTALHLSLYHRDIDSAVQLMSSGAKLDLLWNKPKNWVAFWNDMCEDDVLPLDMVTDDHSLHRVLASISTLQIQMPSRGRCMQCKTSLGTFSRAQHCHHCGRHLCLTCCHKRLGTDYFPKFCAVLQASLVCSVCERILLSRKEEETMDETQPTTPTSYGEEEYQ
jgi:myosin V